MRWRARSSPCLLIARRDSRDRVRMPTPRRTRVKKYGTCVRLASSFVAASNHAPPPPASEAVIHQPREITPRRSRWRSISDEGTSSSGHAACDTHPQRVSCFIYSRRHAVLTILCPRTHFPRRDKRPVIRRIFSFNADPLADRHDDA